ncbi:hypothetical protein IV38_GL001157 [Lactobacillus selangorensis]|uniref:Uncharacterized protein n=1 Tax=Lactobacillus selangorensis TaxID=81857 RepID=A0A0R2FJX8_9LACO|nr:hypothetical protein [Lactobacillus selangorensis]KRN28946.1 hypothetical protein IV38_GL001157 [Lactobacillus selangorensis]KRN32644.1 hypothetical protein IV40_GL000696 [Lactobacillus selangorensis]
MKQTRLASLKDNKDYIFRDLKLGEYDAARVKGEDDDYIVTFAAHDKPVAKYEVDLSEPVLSKYDEQEGTHLGDAYEEGSLTVVDFLNAVYRAVSGPDHFQGLRKLDL